MIASLTHKFFLVAAILLVATHCLQAQSSEHGADGDGTVTVSGTQQKWHNVTLTLAGPWANELDDSPNPFLDYRLTATFTHSAGSKYVIPGYFAADGDAANSSASEGNKWRAHFAPDQTGTWNYTLDLVQGDHCAITDGAKTRLIHSTSGQFEVNPSDKQGRDLRAHGRLIRNGSRYLQFADSGKTFLKFGADAPETLLGYQDFDATVAMKKGVPLKTYSAHEQDWNVGDPVWKSTKGKGLIGAVNYLSGKGANAFSFLTYNAGGDGDNVWPFVERNEKLRYDCSKLDQWGIVFDHATQKGMYLHFKLQETEIDDNRNKNKKGDVIKEALDGGKLETERRLYCREMIARFGHNLALNWNIGEENTQTPQEQMAMIELIDAIDAYDHNIVIHSYPDQQDKVYEPLIDGKSKLTGMSLQNSHIRTTHQQTVKWVKRTQDYPMIVAFDESGSAAHGQCPDLGYKGFDGKDSDGKFIYTEHDVRRFTLWGNLMAGGAGVEYYFGYKFVENDLKCEDWRSRDRSWDYGHIAINFFSQQQFPLADMLPSDELVGNESNSNKAYCLAKQGEVYLVYLPNGGQVELNLSDAKGNYAVQQFNPTTGELINLDQKVAGGDRRVVTSQSDNNQNTNDRLLIVKRAE